MKRSWPWCRTHRGNNLRLTTLRNQPRTMNRWGIFRSFELLERAQSNFKRVRSWKKKALNHNSTIKALVSRWILLETASVVLYVLKQGLKIMVRCQMIACLGKKYLLSSASAPGSLSRCGSQSSLGSAKFNPYSSGSETDSMDSMVEIKSIESDSGVVLRRPDRALNRGLSHRCVALFWIQS